MEVGFCLSAGGEATAAAQVARWLGGKAEFFKAQAAPHHRSLGTQLGRYAPRPRNRIALDRFKRTRTAVHRGGREIDSSDGLFLIFFGEVQIDGKSAAMTVHLRDLTGASLWSTTLAPRPA